MPKKSVKKTNYKDESDDEDYDDDSEFQNSEDEYAEQSGGETTISNELGDDNPSIDIDPDDEKEFDTNGDEIFNPITENEEPVDPDDEADLVDKGLSEPEPEDEPEEETEDDGGTVRESENAEEYAVNTKQCYVKDLNKDFIVIDEDDSSLYNKIEYRRTPNKERISDPIMTYYEMVRIIGTRAQQFNFGAEPLVKGINGLHPAKMAYLELISKMTPYIIRRHLPSKRYEEWRIDELKIIHVITDDFFVPKNFDWELFSEQTNTDIQS